MLPSDTVQNLQNDGLYMEITIRSGKILPGPFVGKSIDSEVVVDKFEESNPVESEKLDSSINALENEREKEEEVVLKTALKQMPGYAKFMKDLMTMKRVVIYELEEILHHCNVISTRTLAQKKPEPGTFTIPCTIGTMEFAKALCDLGENVNLMSLTIYRKLGLGNRTPTNMRLVMVDRLVKRLVSILYDVLVKVSNFIFPAYFIILECEVDFEVPIILGRPFLATRSLLIDLRANELLFRINDKVVRFDMGKSIKQHEEVSVLFVVDVYYEDE
ncbi:uncharacterized protein LOC107878593 [Capsicum annuum]|uniref:uncharacterized protein LOC107878593 n=1 Tax=Capsicum annuum TaxID=4072 RepID=UPI0007BEF441|nr:uncharacterized protein LOC107878593 [Capsicum annuum]